MTARLMSHMVLMLISPVFSLYTGLRDASETSKRWLLIMFVTVYGSIIQIAPGQDGAVHWARVYDHYVGLNFEQFYSELVAIVTLEPQAGSVEDVYIHLLSYFTGAVLGLPQLFFVFVSFIYAYFFAGSLIKILRFVPGIKYDWLFYGFVVVFVLWKSIEGINTVRTWTGLWVLFYGAIQYFDTREKKYLWLMALPPLFHVGYLLMLIPAWLVVLLGPRIRIFVVIYFISFITTINQQSFITSLEQQKLGADKVRGYYIEGLKDYEAESQRVLETSTFHKRLFEVGIQNWGIVVITLLLIISGAAFKRMTPLETSLFSIGLLCKVLANYTTFLYALANRSAIISGIFILAALLLMYQRGYFQQVNLRYPLLQKTVLIFAFILLIPFLFFRVADLIYFVSVFMFLFPFIPWISDELNLSIREFIRTLS